MFKKIPKCYIFLFIFFYRNLCYFPILSTMPVDPTNTQNLFQDLNPVTRYKYLKNWNEFVKHSGINIDMEPKEEHFMAFFKMKRVRGCLGNSLWNAHSCLNAVYISLYNRKLQKFTKIGDYIRACCQEQPVRKNSFKEEEISKFLLEADDSDRFLFVRKVILVFTLCGGYNLVDLRSLNTRDIKLMKEGYKVSFNKQRNSRNQAQIKRKSYIIPYRSRYSAGPCYASIVKKYFHVLSLEVPDKSPEVVFFTGQRKMQGKSTFINTPIGVNTIGKAFSEIAKWLGLENWQDYTVMELR